MRLSEEKIRAGILNAEEQVRLAAVGYYADGRVATRVPMGDVIKAVEQYGRPSAFSLLRRAEGLHQTRRSLDWMIDELDQDLDVANVTWDNYRFALALMLMHAEPELLAGRQREITERGLFPEQLKQGFIQRLEMQSWSWDEALSALERYAKRRRSFSRNDERRALWMVEALAQHTDHSQNVLRRLEGDSGGNGSGQHDVLASFMVQIAGEMRLVEAVPLLVERLLGGDVDLADDCVSALANIGNDNVVRALYDVYWQVAPDDRIGIIEPLDSIHTDLSVKVLLDFFTVEEEMDPAIYSGIALLGKFDDRAIEPVRELLLANTDPDDFNPELEDLRTQLIVNCILMERSFPEFDDWYERVSNDNWGAGDDEPRRVSENFEEDRA